MLFSLNCSNNLSVSGNILNLYTSYFIQKNDNCSLYIGDNSYYDSTNNYGTLSITQPSLNTTRAHISFVRGGNNVVQIGFLEIFGATYANNFGLFLKFRICIIEWN